MKIFLIAVTVFIISIQGSEKSREEYFALIKQYPPIIQPLGDSSKGEIEILTDPEKMAAIEKKQARDVGVVWRDKYWLWVNDACRFPSGHEGIYARMLWVKSLTGTPGVAVMPVLPNGKVVLNCNYRHATRSWEIELPRGGVNPGETLEAAAQREALEETKMVIDSLVRVGEIPPDSGMTTTIVPIFVAKVVKEQNSEQEETEAIEGTIALTRDEIKQAFARGYYLYKIRGEEKKIPFRDPFLAYAVLLSDVKKI
ncbi:MAG: NUDIX hydrolase [Verrucomicrobia bacterium]|nr:NUDIX hydrolase [Verrucomicrobiota bacterium]